MTEDRNRIQETGLETVNSVIIVSCLAAIAIGPLGAAAWLIPPGFPYLLRQLINRGTGDSSHEHQHSRYHPGLA